MAEDEAPGNFADFGPSGNQGVRRQRTPGVASRVKNASQQDQRSMQTARQQLSFSDGAEEEVESVLSENAAAAGFFINGSRGPTATRPKNLVASDPVAMSASWPAAAGFPASEEFPDQAMILERLTSIRQHKRQVLDMIDKLKRESGDGEIDKDMLRKLIEAYDNFKEQEEQYLSVLQKILALKTEYTTNLEDSSISQPEPENPAMQYPMAKAPVRRPVEERVSRPALPQMDEEIIADSGFSSATKPNETDDLQALIEQRNMLKQMLRQQEELRALQGRHKAQQGQSVGEVHAPTFDPDLAYQQVYDQQEVLAAKRRELEDLKKKLDYARSFYGDTPESEEVPARDVRPAPTTGAGHRQQHQLEDKLRVLRGKKHRMDEIINELNALQESTAEDVDRQQRPAVMAAAVLGGQLPIPVNQSGARPKQPMMMPGKPGIRPEMPRNFGMSPNGTAPQEDIRRKLLELEATKSRLAQLQTLVSELEDSGGAMMGPHGLGVSPQLMRLVNELEHEDLHENDGSEGDNTADMSALSSQMRSAYQSKLNEQRDAVDRLQEEHARLTAIKNQLLTLNPLADPLAAEKAAHRGGLDGNASMLPGKSAGVGRPSDDAWRDHHQPTANQMLRRTSESRATPDQRLNNTRDNALASELSAISQQRNIRQTMAPLASGGGSFAAASFLSGDGDELEVEVARSRRGTESGGSTIVSNPRLASFRRNNQLDEVQKQQHRQQHAAGGPGMTEDAGRCQSTPIRGPPGGVDRLLRRRRSSNTVEHQYQQLQQHIDSIRLIFQDLMKDHEEGGPQEQQHFQHGDPLLQQQRMVQAVPASAPVTPSWDVLSLGASPMAVQQHQLMLSLLACQQQLQLQQIEMRYLQQLCQELWQANYNSDGNRTRSGSVNSVNQQQSGAPTAPGTGGLPFGAANFAPFDGRPLSSASLYNLLAPNPYLTLPYYAAPQFGHNFGGMGARGYSRTNNGNGGVHSLPRGAGVLNNYAGSPANNSSAVMKSNRNVETSSVGGRAMSSSVVCQEGQHRGASMSDRMIVSDSELSIVGETTSSPFKVGAAGRLGDYASSTAGGNKTAVPKLNLEDSYKSNVHKCYNNKNSNMVTQTNGVIPELPSRASSTSGAVTNSGHVSVLENGCLTPEQFDLMREAIYSEVATLISQNEQRPNFLLELFRELQLLSNDYLRARALEVIRDILNRYLTDDVDASYNMDQENDRFVNIRNGTLTGTPCRTAVAAAPGDRDDDHLVQNYQSQSALREKPRDFVESTTSESAVVLEHPAGVENFANTSAEKPASRQKRFENLEGIKDVKALNNAASAGAKEGSESNDLPRSQSRDFSALNGLASNGIATASGGKVDVTGLEQQIQTIVDELIPFVRGNVDAECSPQLLQYIRKLVLELTTSKCIPPESVSTFFRLQLSSILDDTLVKFRGQKLHECGAELLADVSEVVFNELAFFRLMQNIDTTLVSRHSQSADSEASTADGETGNAETSESAPLDDVVSETNGERGESELSSSRQSSLEDELSPMSVPDAVSEVSEDLSAVTAVSVSREAEKVPHQAAAIVASDIEIPIAGLEEQSSPAKKRGVGGQRKSIETVLLVPLMVQVTAATDEEEITTTTNNSSSSLNTSSSGSESMHTAGENGSITSDQVELLKTPPTGGSRETSPPDDIDEVPEQLEHEPGPPIDNNDVTFDLTFEPHPEDQLHLSSGAGQNIHLAVAGAGEEDEEEEEANVDEIRRSTTPVMARAVAYLAESSGSTEVTPTDVTNIVVSGVVSTAN